MNNITIVIFGMIAFALVHSITADRRIKAQVQQWLGERVYHGFYRLVYNVLSVLLLAPLMLITLPQGRTIWVAPNALLPFMFVLQALGFIGMALSLLQIDLLRFAGVKQIMAYFAGEALPLPPEKLKTDGIYGFVRHPLYLFALMLLWPISPMTDVYLAYVLMATLYFVLGSLVEEQRMVRFFGDEYVRYQQRVPWLLPLPRNRKNTA
jgi:methanethiol S-methyltransferase